MGGVSLGAPAPELHHLDWSKGRRALRVGVSTGRGDEVVEAEVSVDQLLAALAEAGDEPLMPRFLLFAGDPGRPAGGIRDLVGAYRDEGAAKAAFRRVRSKQVDDGAWAELAAVDSMGRSRPVCWFGRDWRVRREETAVPVAPAPAPRWWLTSLRSLGRP